MPNEDAIRDYHAQNPQTTREVGEATSNARDAAEQAKRTRAPEDQAAADEAITEGRKVVGAYGRTLGDAMENRTKGPFRRR
ncbi:MAG TPA: hypothetical protein VHU91_10895 [Mycobacteriales bacterium]|nr:hypothetical protein [Mycobacteriales bacterium]